MKRIWVLVFLILMVGCSNEKEKVSIEQEIQNMKENREKLTEIVLPLQNEVKKIELEIKEWFLEEKEMTRELEKELETVIEKIEQKGKEIKNHQVNKNVPDEFKQSMNDLKEKLAQSYNKTKESYEFLKNGERERFAETHEEALFLFTESNLISKEINEIEKKYYEEEKNKEIDESKVKK